VQDALDHDPIGLDIIENPVTAVRKGTDWRTKLGVKEADFRKFRDQRETRSEALDIASARSQPNMSAPYSNMPTMSASASRAISIFSTGFVFDPGFGDDLLKRPLADAGFSARLNFRAQAIEPYLMALIRAYQWAFIVNNHER
jgi:hypothetical protein